MSGIGNGRSLKLPVALLCSLLVSYLVLVPLDAPLYDLILFPIPDPRTPDVQPKLQQLRNSGVIVKDVAFKSANGRLLYDYQGYGRSEGKPSV